MKKPPSNTEIVDQIIIHLGKPLRRPRMQAEAEKAIALSVEMLRGDASRPFPNADLTRKIAKNMCECFENLCEALEPFGDGQLIPLKGCDRLEMTVGEFRSALHWFQHIDGPSSKVNIPKHFAAIQADCLVNEFSQKLPTGTIGGQVREIISGEVDTDLKRQIDAARRSWSDPELFRGR